VELNKIGDSKNDNNWLSLADIIIFLFSSSYCQLNVRVILSNNDSMKRLCIYCSHNNDQANTLHFECM